MAITQGTPTTAAFTTAGTSFACNIPTGVTTATFLWALVAVENDGQPTVITAPASGPAWTLIDQAVSAASDPLQDLRVALYRRWGTASEPANQAWTTATSVRATVIIMPLTGVDATTPVDVAPVWQIASANETSVVHPGVTTVTDHAWVETTASGDSSTTVWTAPTTPTGITFDVRSDGRSTSVSHLDKSPAGATGTITWGFSGASLPRIVATFALRPAVATGQFAYPSADVVVGGWSTDTGATTNLYQAIDEVSASDADYVRSAITPSNDVYRVQLAAVSNPGVTTGHIVHYRYAKDTAAGDRIDLIVELLEGPTGSPTVIASWTHTDIGSTITQADQTLTGAQAANIAAYGDLRLRFTANKV